LQTTTLKEYIMNARHLKRLAAIHKVAIADIRLAIKRETISDRVQAIRDRRKKTTIKQARALLGGIDAAAEQYREEHEIGRRRRGLSRVDPTDPTDPTDRRLHQARRLLGTSQPAGAGYSGDTRWIISLTDGPTTAKTTTDSGERYSGRAREYAKTDAEHTISVNLSDLWAARQVLPDDIDGCLIVRAKQVRERVYAVRLLRTVRQRADYADMYVADQGDGRYHLAKTERGAVTALNRAQRADDASRADRISAAVTRRWGWCAAGVRQWCDRHNVRRDIRRRLRDGARSAAIARLIAKHGGPCDAYERRICLAAYVK